MKLFDVVVIGAGIHGAGVAQAAAAAGYSVMVLEKNGVASGTSSKSSKLIHGGLRYLESYQFTLVRKSLKERAVLCRLAPDLVKLKPFYIPIYKKTTRRPWQIRTGLSVYAFLGGLDNNNLFKTIKRNEIVKRDHLAVKNLQQVFKYNDGQTNDMRLTKAVILSAKALGAEITCPAKVVSIIKEDSGFNILYQTDTVEKNIKAKVVINAAGPWVNELHQLVSPKAKSLGVDLVQGTHIIIDAPAPSGIFYLEAIDQRAVFIMPYEFNDELKTMIGTTEKIFQGKADDVQPTKAEMDYLLNVYRTYFPENEEIKIIHQFAGLRVLPKSDGSMFSRPRDTILHWSLPKLLTLYGGKLTAYRSTSELVIKKIKPYLEKRQRIAYTDQLYLTDKIDE
jgi:glycerol-3-phosphate dehydrogenase